MTDPIIETEVLKALVLLSYGLDNWGDARPIDGGPLWRIGYGEISAKSGVSEAEVIQILNQYDEHSAGGSDSIGFGDGEDKFCFYDRAAVLTHLRWTEVKNEAKVITRKTYSPAEYLAEKARITALAAEKGWSNRSRAVYLRYLSRRREGVA